jgi:hypothetical protein
VVFTPAKVLPSKEDFDFLQTELRRRGFREITGSEFHRDFKRLGLVAPRPRKGRETGFVFTANQLTVKIWTTWLSDKLEAREEDAGWVLIVDRDSARYFCRPLHRTKNFVRNLLRHAWIAWWRVLHRPLCPECKQFMDIAYGRGIGARYWRCNRLANHSSGKPENVDWDINLPPRAKKYVEEWRRERRRYLLRRRREGKPENPARFRRKRWVKTNPAAE